MFSGASTVAMSLISAARVDVFKAFANSAEQKLGNRVGKISGSSVLVPSGHVFILVDPEARDYSRG